MKSPELTIDSLELFTNTDELSAAWDKVRVSLNLDDFTNLQLMLAVHERLSDLVIAEIAEMLGEERSAALLQLEELHLSYRELMRLVDQDLLHLTPKDGQHAEAPMRAIVDKDSFSLNFNGRTIWERTFDFDSASPFHDHLDGFDPEKVRTAADLIRTITESAQEDTLVD